MGALFLSSKPIDVLGMLELVVSPVIAQVFEADCYSPRWRR